ncbi:peroxisomal membrane protein 11C [Cimex lectularius]|uniref:Peroxisomal membrane protein 11C n=1 Tax=Cimex lectularius TaxID=79782 RepID=A0A8I6RU76_CIMLE|nr:peroxisomal membrane protein 11C [Cimex lectularius]
MPLEDIVVYLESYGGRDRVMRLLYYSAQYISGVSRWESLNHKLNVFSDQINSCRTVLRLFDDVPMLSYTLSYGLGHSEAWEPRAILRILGVMINILDQLYYPLEHIAWAADCKLISIRSSPWWTASSFCWALSMCLMMVKSLLQSRFLSSLKQLASSLDKNHWTRKLNVPFYDLVSHSQLNKSVTATRCFLDFVHAVHWLPSGVLWAGKLKQWQTGALGILSSLLSIYQSLCK